VKYVTIFANLKAEVGLWFQLFSHSELCGRINIIEFFIIFPAVVYVLPYTIKAPSL